MKRSVCSIALLLGMIVVLLCGCTVSPKSTADTFMQGIKTKDAEKIASVYNVEASNTENTVYGLVDSSSSEGKSSEEIKGVEKYAQYMSKLFDFDYELSNEQIDGDIATVDVKITAYNYGSAFTTAFSTIMSQALVLAFSSDQTSIESYMEQTFLSEFSKAEKNSELTATLNLVKKDKKWVVEDISENTTFINALTGGLYDSVIAVTGKDNQ